MSAYEKGEWEKLDEDVKMCCIEIEDLSKGYMEALAWTDEMFKMMD